MTTRKKVVLVVDYQNMYCKARELEHDFHIMSLLNYVEQKYSLRREDVFVFMSQGFYENMHERAKRKIHGTGVHVKLPSRKRLPYQFDPVDKSIISFIKKQLRRTDIEGIVLASSDGDFAPLGDDAWERGKQFYLIPYDDPSHKFTRTTQNIVRLREVIRPNER